MTRIGHNNPPTPVEDCAEAYANLISEVENWCDGDPVTDEASMNAADDLAKRMRGYRADLKKSVTEYTKPAHDEWKRRVAHGKTYTDDADAMQKALAALVADFKAELAAQKEAEKRAAYEEAQRLEREAQEAARQASAADLDAQREVEAKRRVALDAEKAAQFASKDKVKGLRRVTKYEITDMADVVNWIARNDKDAMADFAAEYVRKNHKAAAIAGVRVWEVREAY